MYGVVEYGTVAYGGSLILKQTVSTGLVCRTTILKANSKELSSRVVALRRETKALTCQVNVVYIAGTENLVARVLVRRLSSLSLVVRLIVRKVTTVNFVSRLTILCEFSRDLVSRTIILRESYRNLVAHVDVIYTEADISLVSRVVILRESLTSLISRIVTLRESFFNLVSRLIIRVVARKSLVSRTFVLREYTLGLVSRVVCLRKQFKSLNGRLICLREARSNLVSSVNVVYIPGEVGIVCGVIVRVVTSRVLVNRLHVAPDVDNSFSVNSVVRVSASAISTVNDDVSLYSVVKWSE